MPKIIAHLQESILAQAKALLLEQGWSALTIRAVAARCDVAVGTVYNYYPSKDALVAGVLMEDWQKAMTQLQQETRRALTLREGIRIIARSLCSFEAQYQPVWEQYAQAYDAAKLMKQYHEPLIGAISDAAKELLLRFEKPEDAALPVFLAEILLHLAGRGMAQYEQIEHLLFRMVGEVDSQEDTI